MHATEYYWATESRVGNSSASRNKKIMAGMVYGGNGENGGIGLKNGGSVNFRRHLSPPNSLRESRY
jgi:hypothetical protein